MVEAATEFRKNSFNDEDSVALAKVAAMFTNVADEAIGASESAEFIISQMIAFGIEAKNASTIIDKVNETANQFAVSSGDLATALKIVASTSSAMGNDINETLGIVTAITEQTKSASKAARGANAIFANLAQVLDDTSSNGEKIAAIFNDIGVAMYDQDGQLKSAYDLLSGLAEKWGTLDGNTQKYIATTLAGTTQLNNFLALMNNFDHAISATETSMNSFGSAARENSRYLESLEAKTTLLKSTFQDLANNVIDDELVGGLLDIGNSFLQLANTDIGQFITQVTLLGGISWGAKSLLDATKILKVFISQFKEIGTVVGLVKNVHSLSDAFTLISMSGGAALPIILGISAALIGIVSGVKKISDEIKENKIENLTTKANELNTSIEQTNKGLETARKRLEELNNVPIGERTYAWKNERAELEYTIQRYEYLLRLQENERRGVANKITQKRYVESGGIKVVGNVASQSEVAERGQGWLLESGRYVATDAQITAINDAYSTTAEAVYKLAGAFNIQAEEGLSATEELEYLQNELKEYGVFITKETVSTNEYVEAQRKQGQIILSQIPQYRSLTAVQKETIQQWVDQNKEYAEAIRVSDTVSNEQRELLSTYDAVAEGLYKVSNATVMATEEEAMMGEATTDLSKRAKEIASDLIALSNEVDETAESFLSLVAQEIIFNNTNLSVSQKIEALKQLALQAGVTANAIAGVTYSAGIDQNLVRRYMAEGLSKKEAFDKAAQQSSSGALLDYWSALSALPKDEDSKSGGRNGSKSATDTKLEALMQLVALRKSELALLEAQDAPIESQIAKQKEIQDALHQEAEHLRKIGAEQSDINELSTEWWQIQKEINSTLKDALSSYADFFQSIASRQIDNIEQQIDEIEEIIDGINEKYDAQIDALEEENKALEKQIQLEEYLQALASAKDIKKLVYKDGRFQYVSDVDAVSSAQANLDEFNREKALEEQKDFIEEQRKNEIEEYNNKIEALEGQKQQWQAYSDGWSKLVEDYELAEQALQLQQYSVVVSENGIWQERISNLQNFVGQYTNLLSGLSGAVSNLFGGLNLSGIKTALFGEGGGAIWSSNPLTWREQGYDSLADWYWDTQMKGDKYQISDVIAGMDDDSPEHIKDVYAHFGGEKWEDVDYAQKIIEAASTDKYNTADIMYWAKKRQDKIASLGIEGDVESTRDLVERLTGGHYQLYANGTKSALGGISLVGEQGPELRVLNSGDGVIPADITRNLWDWGKFNPKSMMSTMSQVFNIDNLTLPNVRDAQSLVTGLKQMAYQRAYKRA